MSVDLSQPLPERWGVLAALIGVLIMTPLDSSAVNIILPVVQQQFHAPLNLIAWISLVYLLVIASLMLPVGRLGDLWGFRRLFLGGVILFTASSALCGLAPSLGWLITARVIQGIGACLMMALSSGIVTAIFPAQERGRALGLMGMGIAFGLVLGPTLGGLITNLAGWRWIFYINVPIGLIGGIICRRKLPALNPAAHHAIDYAGAALAMLTLGALMLAITQGETWGWSSPFVLGLFALSLIGAMLFIRTERRQPAPMLHLGLFANPVFTGANIATMMNYLGQFCALFLTPLLLQRAMHFSPERAGFMMAAIPVAVLVLAPISGALSDKLGTRTLAIVGESLVTIGLVCMAFVLGSGRLPAMIGSLLLVGAGAGLFQSPNNSAIMGSVPRTHLGIGGGVLATMRNVGMALGIAISSAVATIGAAHFLAAHPVQTIPSIIFGIRMAYIVGAGFAFLGVITSAVRQDRPVVGERVTR